MYNIYNIYKIHNAYIYIYIYRTYVHIYVFVKRSLKTKFFAQHTVYYTTKNWQISKTYLDSHLSRSRLVSCI